MSTTLGSTALMDPTLYALGCPLTDLLAYHLAYLYLHLYLHLYVPIWRALMAYGRESLPRAFPAHTSEVIKASLRHQ